MPDESSVFQEEGHRLTVKPREVDEIDWINSAFARLALRDERLGSPKRFRDTYLRHAGLKPRRAKSLEHGLVTRLVNSADIPH